MRIEQLRFQAFGPYVQQQTIDFAQLQDHLFLIRGETGAGKTAILDAITYALYGYSSGGDRGEFESMRCRLAKDDRMTFVECIFSIHHRRYRFYRQVEVHKKRTKEITWRTKIDAGELLEDGYYPFFENCKQRAVEEKAKELIGLSHAQFIQVMMLPQGKFEQLLISSSEAKQEILKSLFQVEKWEDICERLVEKLKLEKEAMEQMRSQIQLLLQQSKIERTQDFKLRLQEVTQRYEEQKIIANQVHEEYQNALQQVQEQTQIQAILASYDARNQEQDALIAKKGDMELLGKQMETYKQYLQVKPYYDAMMQSQIQLQERASYMQEILKQEVLCKEEQDKIQQETISLQPKAQELEVLQKQYNALQEEYERFTQQEQFQKEYALVHKKWEEEQRQLTNLEKAYEQKRQELDELLKENKELEKAVQAYPEILKQEQLYENALQYQTQYEALIESKKRLQKRIDALQTQLTICLKEEKICEIEHEKRYQYFLQHSADLLAQSLIEGSPCPVCGSLDHPQRSHILLERDVVGNLREGKEALTKAKEQTQMLHEKKQVEQSQLQSLDQQAEAIKQQLLTIVANGYDSQLHAQLQKQCKQKEEQMQQRLTIAQMIEDDTKKLQAFEQLMKQHQTCLQGYSQDMTILQTKIKERNHSGEFKDRRHFLTYMNQQKEKMDSYEQRLAMNLEKKQENAHAIAIILTKVASAKSEYEKEQKHFEKAKAQYDQQPIHLPQDMKIKEMNLDEVTQQLKTYEQKCVEVASAKKQLALQLANKEKKDLQQLKAQAEKTQDAYQSSSKVLATYESEFKSLQQNEKNAYKLEKKWELAFATYEQLQGFVKAMRGDNSIGIERYVLGVMLSQITQVANQMLSHVHHGRYQIYRSDETSGRVRKFGLELSIYDTYSCSQRSVVSLSGGEKFLVSLALSLALSMVVQARSGGIYLETMFIDEGFGSLDEQSIADALQVLSSMGKQKAMIGIISHVELLKENIPYGIQVRKQRVGSTLTMLY